MEVMLGVQRSDLVDLGGPNFGRFTVDHEKECPKVGI